MDPRKALFITLLVFGGLAVGLPKANAVTCFTSTDGVYTFAASYTINTNFQGEFDGTIICHYNVIDITYNGIIVTVNSPVTAITDAFTGDYFVSLQGSGWPGYTSQTVLATHTAQASSFDFPSFSITVDANACETANMKVGRYKTDGSVADGDLAFILEAPPCHAVPEFGLPMAAFIATLAPIMFALRRRTR